MDIRNIEAKAARLGDVRHEWNELDFVGWNEFRRMAPAVVRLETARLERVMGHEEPGTDIYNTLVLVRHELRRFADGLDEAEIQERTTRTTHLNRALLALAAAGHEEDLLQYVRHRLQYIHERLQLVY